MELVERQHPGLVELISVTQSFTPLGDNQMENQKNDFVKIAIAPPPPPQKKNNNNTAYRGQFQVNVNPIGDST